MSSHQISAARSRERNFFRVFWWAFLACPVFYGVAGCFLEVGEGHDMILLVLALAAAVTFTMSFLIKRLLAENALARDQEDRSRGEAKFPNRLAGVMIVVWVLTESVGVFGLVARFFGADMKTLLGFIGLALVGMLLHRPPRGAEEVA